MLFYEEQNQFSMDKKAYTSGQKRNKNDDLWITANNINKFDVEDRKTSEKGEKDKYLEYQSKSNENRVNSTFVKGKLHRGISFKG